VQFRDGAGKQMSLGSPGQGFANSCEKAKAMDRGKGRESALDENSANRRKRTANSETGARCAATSTKRAWNEKGRREAEKQLKPTRLFV
jgi:hypothetical protein